MEIRVNKNGLTKVRIGTIKVVPDSPAYVRK